MPTEGPSGPKRRRRRTSESDEEPISMWKIGLVIAVIVLCFAMLYPTLFRPFLSSYFSPPASQKPSKSAGRPPIHPSMAAGPRGHPEIHPGMRMGGNQAQATTTGSSSKGMLGWFLPIYTVGVVSFLLYTLFKSKKKKRRQRETYSTEESESEEEEIPSYSSGKIKLGKKKLEGLQKRLKQTEAAMEKILEQLGTLTSDHEQQEVSLGATEEFKEEDLKAKEISVQKNEKYLKDLEKALSDFKKLSQDREKMKKQKPRRKNDSEEEIEDDVYEVIEAGDQVEDTASEEEKEPSAKNSCSDEELVEAKKSQVTNETNLKRRRNKGKSKGSIPQTVS